MTGTPQSASTSVFVVRSFDIDAFGYLNPARLAGFLQQAASESADSFGFGVSDLNRRGLTWVLVRQRWELLQSIVLGDELEIETWPSGIDRRAALRDFRLSRNGVEIGRAITSWFVLDLATRRPVRPSVVLGEQFQQASPHVLDPPSDAIAALGQPTEQRSFAVRHCDIDLNQHVTNATYVAWGLEAVDVRTWRDAYLTALDVQFLCECQLGASILSRATQVQPQRWLHSIVRESDLKELARMTSHWERRP